jgi:hypothetical protein
LTPEQQREIARLHGETKTPTTEIRERFGIAESSLYRILQKQGVSPRGRTNSPSRVATGVVTIAAGRRRRGRTRRGALVGSQVRGASKTAVSQNSAALRFRVCFEGQRVFEAQDVRDAVRQAERLGVTDIREVLRLPRRE